MGGKGRGREGRRKKGTGNERRGKEGMGKEGGEGEGAPNANSWIRPYPPRRNFAKCLIPVKLE